MQRNHLVSVFAVAASAAAMLTGGCALAATAAPAASARAGAATGGTANIMIYSVNTDGPYLHAIVSGVVGGYGRAVTIYPDGKIDPEHNSEVVLRLAHGSFRLSIRALDAAFNKVARHEPIYPKTCSDFMRVTETSPVVADSGTGAYRGIRGSFRLTLTSNEVEATPCATNGPSGIRAQLITVAGSGRIAL
jgi:hypothetical protein